MQKEFLPYELALRMKGLGFDDPCFGWYHKEAEEILLLDTDEYFMEGIEFKCGAPLFQQALRWFREELKYEVFLQKQENLVSGKTYSFLIENDLEGIYERSLSKSSIDKAELACLEKLIEIVEQSKSE